MRSGLLITALALVGGNAHPQRLPRSFASHRDAVGLSRPVVRAQYESVKGPSPLILAAGGVVGGAIGAGAGVATHSWPILAATEPTLMPLGVHLANRRQGSYPLDLLASVGSLGVLYVGENAFGQARTGADSDRFWITASVVQIVAVVVVERVTARRRARAE